MLHINGNIVTLADFGLERAARPVLKRTRAIERKRKARAESRLERAEAERLSIRCEDGRVIRPIAKK